MLKRFFSNFHPDQADTDFTAEGIDSAEEIIPRLSGTSFEGGLYRVHDNFMSQKWTKVVTEVFHQYEGRVKCFGCDWLGRQFALDFERVDEGNPQILLFQVGTGQVYEVPAGIIGFHDHILIEMAEPTLERSLYQNWREAGNPKLNPSQCAGYKVPPIVGGRDEIENLILIDMEVEWQITAQLLEMASKIPAGSRIDSANIE